VRKLEKFNVDGHELIDRVRMLEGRLEVVARAKMPDIDPQEVHRRLDELTQRADQLHEAATAHSNKQEQVGGGGGGEQANTPHTPHRSDILLAACAAGPCTAPAPPVG
jgi:hypothetical protein